MKKIAFLIPEFPSQTHAFFIRERAELKKLGVETQLISTRRPIGQAGIASHVWAAEAEKETSYLFPLSVKEILLCFLELLLSGPISWFRCLAVVFGRSDMSFAERIKMFAMILSAAFLKKMCRKKRLPHIHVHSCANASSVAMFSRLMGGPTYSLTLHGPMHDYGSNQAQKWKHAAFCIVITEELVAEVKEKLGHIKLPPLYLAPMGVNTEDFKRRKKYRPAEHDDVIRLVSCGRLNFVKGHDDLIRVVAALKGKGFIAKLNICGAMDAPSEESNYAGVLTSIAKELGVENQVNLLGSVSEQRVKEVLESAHFFCLASLKEPLGVATMEAMSMEVPVIVTRSPGVSEMVTSEVDGILVEPRSPDQFASAITALVDSPDKAIALSKQGRNTVVSRFNSGISAGKIAEGLSSDT